MIIKSTLTGRAMLAGLPAVALICVKHKIGYSTAMCTTKASSQGRHQVTISSRVSSSTRRADEVMMKATLALARARDTTALDKIWAISTARHQVVISRWAIAPIRAADEEMTGMALRAQDIIPLHTTLITRLARYRAVTSSRALLSTKHRPVVPSRACLSVQGHPAAMSSRALSSIREPNTHGTIRLAFLHGKHRIEWTATIHTT